MPITKSSAVIDGRAEGMQPTIQELTLDAPIAGVTLLEDRAQVRRVGTAHLTAGLWHLRVQAVAPVLSDKSLRAEFCQEYPTARIDDVRVRRQRLVKAADRPAMTQMLLEEWRSLRQTFDDLGEDRQHLETSFSEIEEILTKTVQELPIDAVWGQLDPKTWREQLQSLFKQLRDYRHDLLKHHDQQAFIAQQLNDLAVRIQSAQRPDSFFTADLEADLMIATAGEYAIAFEYVVPNALWRPWHQAHLQQSEPVSLNFRVDGCVWQRTGEDWQDVDLIFSTARSSLGTEPPLLQDDLLNVQEKSKQIVVQSRDQKLQTAGLGRGTSTTPGTIELPGVADGGEVRTLRALTKATIPSDGRPYRVPLFAFTTPAQVEYVLMPELSCQVILKSEQINTAALPILAGPIDLIRASEFVGRTAIGFIAPGEKFALGWGPDGAMRVQRTHEQEKDQHYLTRWYTNTHTIRLFFSNIGAESRRIKTTERLPISELEQVKVEVVTGETTEGVQPDENGFCTWEFTLEPYTQSQATLVYKVSSAPEVQGL
jgi:uncharacterized protein (TIGR02231 family)